MDEKIDSLRTQLAACQAHNVEQLGSLERVLIPVGYLNLWEGGYNHNETPTFTKEPQTMASLPGNFTRCWPIYDLASVLTAIDIHRATDTDALDAAIAKAVEVEREACADEAERMMLYPGGRCEAPAHDGVWAAAEAIRARGKP